MSKLITKISHKAGLAHGTLVHIGEKRTKEVRIPVIDYDEKQLTDKEVKSVEECFPFKDKPITTWVNNGNNV